MLHIVRRLIRWTGSYRKRIYIGFVYVFLHSVFTAMPIVLAAYGLSLVLADFNGTQPLNIHTMWYLLLGMIAAVLGKFLFSYLRAITQESVGYEATAKQRIRLGHILKRVSLGFFGQNNLGELTSAVTTDLSFMEMFAMNMVNTVVNGYIMVITLIVCLGFYCLPAGVISLACFAVCFIPESAGEAQPQKRSAPPKGTGRYGGSLHRVSARDAGR
jgi:ATP-binding cassette subfamily B protein IrtB